VIALPPRCLERWSIVKAFVSQGELPSAPSKRLANKRVSCAPSLGSFRPCRARKLLAPLVQGTRGDFEVARFDREVTGVHIHRRVRNQRVVRQGAISGEHFHAATQVGEAHEAEGIIGLDARDEPEPGGIADQRHAACGRRDRGAWIERKPFGAGVSGGRAGAQIVGNPQRDPESARLLTGTRELTREPPPVILGRNADGVSRVVVGSRSITSRASTRFNSESTRHCPARVDAESGTTRCRWHAPGPVRLNPKRRSSRKSKRADPVAPRGTTAVCRLPCGALTRLVSTIRQWTARAVHAALS